MASSRRPSTDRASAGWSRRRLRSGQSIVGIIGEIPKIPIRVEGVEAHRLFQKLNGLRRLVGVDERVGVFGNDVAVVRIERHGVPIFDERFLELLAIELGVAQFGKAASVERVELFGAPRKIGRDLKRLLGDRGPPNSAACVKWRCERGCNRARARLLRRKADERARLLPW
jgi:hypothetical protein